MSYTRNFADRRNLDFLGLVCSQAIGCNDVAAYILIDSCYPMIAQGKLAFRHFLYPYNTFLPLLDNFQHVVNAKSHDELMSRAMILLNDGLFPTPSTISRFHGGNKLALPIKVFEVSHNLHVVIV